MAELTPFQKYLLEQARLGHGQTPPRIPKRPTLTPDDDWQLVDDDELEQEDEQEEEQEEQEYPAWFDETNQQALLEVLEWLVENSGLPWEIIINQMFGDGDNVMTIQEWLDSFTNEDGSLNGNLLWERFTQVLGMLRHWGDASFGGKLSDFPFREQLFNGWFGWEGGGGYFGAIWEAINELYNQVMEGELFGGEEETELNSAILDLLRLIIRFIKISGGSPFTEEDVENGIIPENLLDALNLQVQQNESIESMSFKEYLKEQLKASTVPKSNWGHNTGVFTPSSKWTDVDKLPPTRSGDEGDEGDEPVDPPKPDPASKLESDDFYGEDDGVMPRPNFETEYEAMSDDNVGNLLTYCATDLKPWWLNAEVWQEVLSNANNFFTGFPWDGTPEEQSQYLIDFINTLTFYDPEGDPIDMGGHVGQITDMLIEWVQDMIENGIDEYDNDGISGIPNTEDFFDLMSPTQRYIMLQRLKALYNFLHGFIEDLESAG